MVTADEKRLYEQAMNEARARDNNYRGMARTELPATGRQHREYTLEELARKATGQGYSPLPVCLNCQNVPPSSPSGPFCDCVVGRQWETAYRKEQERQAIQRRERLERRFGTLEVPIRYRGKGPHTIPAGLIGGKEAAIAAVRVWAKGKLEKPGLLLLGKPGVGKSVLGWWALRQRQEIDKLWVTWPDLYREIQAGYRTGDSTRERLQAVSKVSVLFLDDCGDPDWRELETKDRRDILCSILDARVQAWRPTLITSNLSGNALKGQFGDRITSRILELCHDIVMGGCDLRRAMR